jgi:hypothetical protein
MHDREADRHLGAVDRFRARGDSAFVEHECEMVDHERYLAEYERRVAHHLAALA